MPPSGYVTLESVFHADNAITRHLFPSPEQCCTDGLVSILFRYGALGILWDILERRVRANHLLQKISENSVVGSLRNAKKSTECPQK